jgi:hypothetical protein
MKYYSAPKSSEILTHATTWMSLEGVMVSEKVRKQRTDLCSTHPRCLRSQSHRQKAEWCFPGATGRGKWGIIV